MKKSKSRRTPENPTRREFARTLALVAAAPAVASRVEARETAAAQSQSNQTASPAAEALLDYVKKRYGQFLNEEQLAAVRRGIEGNLRAAERLRQMNFSNGDEPAFAFTAEL